jgi:centromere/kinetochore protein ZW10
MAEMAFPVPAHLPRKQDVSSKILNKIDSATQTLDSALTLTWLNELDLTIQTTKVPSYLGLQWKTSAQD